MFKTKFTEDCKIRIPDGPDGRQPNGHGREREHARSGLERGAAALRHANPYQVGEIPKEE